MRLKSLYIKAFKNLRDFEMDFDERSLSTVVVGRNGTGKSNVIEALVLIFRHLDLESSPPFQYRISYECRNRVVRIDASRDTIEASAGTSPDTIKRITKKDFGRVTKYGIREYLPAHVFGYYSGPGNRLEEHFEAHHTKFYRDLLKGKATAHLRPLFYARNVHSQFVLLAFFSGLGGSQAEFLERYLGIRGFDSALFVLNEPGWGRTPRYKNYEWFWRARGAVRDFLDRLFQQALAPIRIPKQRVPLGLARSEHRDHYFLYIPDEFKLKALAELYDSQQEFFAALESTYISDLIREVRVRVKIGKDRSSLSFRELSEGEQQLLMVLGLLKFTHREEALFLLDEPDTHLNPAWSVEYLSLLRDVVGDDEHSHFIIATHDPLVIAGLTKEQVQLLERDESGIIRASQPADDPRGMGISALLTSEVYGLRSELDLYTLEKIDRKRDLSLKDDLTAGEIEELREANVYLEGLDFMNSDRDPAYSSWVQLLHTIEEDLGIEGAILSPSQMKALQEKIKIVQEKIAGRLN